MHILWKSLFQGMISGRYILVGIFWYIIVVLNCGKFFEYFG